MKTQEVQTDRWPARFAVGDVVHYRGRTYTVIEVAAPVVDAVAPWRQG